MQILNIWTKFEAFECKLEPFKRDSKHSNANSNLEMDSKHSNANSNHSKRILMEIRTIWKGFEAFECKFGTLERVSKHSNANLKHLKGIQSIQLQILTIRKVFEEFNCKF